MSLTPNEAATALRDIERTGRLSGEAFGYRLMAPHLVIWGIVWAIGYAGGDLLPQDINMIWAAVVILGTVASLVTGSLMSKGREGSGTWRFGVLVLVFWAFLIGTYAIMGPIGPRQQGAFVPLVISAIYAGVGLWAGARLLLTGIGVAALTLFGYFYVDQHFGLWMAAVGGGGLMLAGLWLRTA